MNYLKPMAILTACVTVNLAVLAAESPQNWPAFRGPSATGITEGYPLPTVWNATANSPKSQGVLWRTSVPGLGHSSPVVWGDRIFLCTVVAENGKSPLVLGAGGRPTAADGSFSATTNLAGKSSGDEPLIRESRGPRDMLKPVRRTPVWRSTENTSSPSLVLKDSIATTSMEI